MSASLSASATHALATVSFAERRRAPRFSLCSLVWVMGEHGATGHGTLEDLSNGGALLTGTLELSVGEEVRVLLPLPGDHPALFVGRVVRRRQVDRPGALPGQGQLAYGVMFHHAHMRDMLTPSQRMGLETTLRKTQPQRPAVLVVDSSTAACAPTVLALSEAGYPAVAVTNAFDAVRWVLGASRFAAAVVNPGPRLVDGPSLLTYLADEHPSVKRVTIHTATALPPVTGAERGPTVQPVRAQAAARQVSLPGPLLVADVAGLF